MPGLSQLKQFNKDLLSLGDELTIRASRGEKPVQVIIPKEVEDKNDSEDFVLGMPQIEAEVEAAPVEEDLSDLVGLATPSSSSSGTAEPAPSFEAPDLSSLLNPINIPDDASAGVDMPDLSMFEEPEEQEEEVQEEEPEEISIADMGLDALLSGGGFDAPEEEPESEPETESEPLSIDDFQEVEDIDSLDAEEIEPAGADDGLSDLERDLFAMEGSSASEPAQKTGTGDPELDDLLGNLEFDTPDSLAENAEEIEEVAEAPEELTDLEFLDNLAAAGTDENLNDEPLEDLGQNVAADLGLESLGDLDLPKAEEKVAPVEEFSTEGLDDLGDFGLPEEGAEGLEAVDDLGGSEETAAASDFDLESLGDLDLPEAGEEAAPAEEFSTEGLDDLGNFDLPEEGAEGLEAVDDLGGSEETAAAADLGLESLGDLDLPEVGEESTPAEEFSTEGLDDLGNFDLPEEGAEGLEAVDDLGGSEDTDVAADLGLESLGDFDLPEVGEESTPAEEFSTEGLDDFGDFSTTEAEEVAPTEEFSTEGLDNLDNFDLPEDGAEGDETAPSIDDFNIGDISDITSGEDSDGMEESSESEEQGEASGLDSFSLDDMDFGSPTESVPVDFDAEEEIPDYGEDSSEDSETDFDENGTPEVFDTTEMEGLDFGIPDTDAQLNGGSDFELGGADDFAMEGEFEIPGFSDVQTAKEEKSKTTLAAKNEKGKHGKKNLPEPDFSDAEESEDLPPNTLSDVQYKQFLKNLGEYPLNVRLAFEDLIVQDEFTDDAEFEVIEKILNKAPARQVASMLEKMLDTSIPVPRDFEHRTAEEYEAYKKSLSYQLKNKIIPGLLVGILALLVLWGLFNFSKNCIYKPLKANKLYKQGYALLEADEYPQSEMKFEEAVTYRINKKWFFNYARGYREHRQYQRAGNMYDRILKYYKHDKAAGLEYADMELNDLANYKRAEEIVRREILDYHINDADGILKLGDIFLEWGTEKDPEKLENAREQYATLIQLYKSTDLYLSRMMRYFIRTDNLRQVIQMKNTFEPREKSLGAEDWTELSGYLLEKYYGTLAPSDEYLRYEIEGLRGLLLRSVKANPNNPIALYNLAKYFIQSGETAGIENTLQNAIEKFNTIQSMKKRDIYKYIDSYRLLGEHYIDTTDFLQAQEQFAEGISLYTTERDNAGFEGTPDIGKLYADMGNIKYTISGDYDDALMNYKYSVELENDTPSIRYRIGYIQYKNNNYVEALGSFMKAGDGNVKQRNLLLAMANTLSLRGDDYAAQGYYNQLIESLDAEIVKRGAVFPQASIKDYDVVNTYLSAANNYGVTLYKLAKRTGNSGLNAQAIVQFQQSLRAWDALTRNQETMVRLGGSNLAEQNIQYITHPIPEFEPAIYTDIAKTLLDNEHL